MSERPSVVEDTTLSGTRQVIASPEGVLLELLLAGPTSRMLAYAIDLICIGMLAAFIVLLFANPLVLLRSAVTGLGEQWADELRDPERAIDAVRQIALYAVSFGLLLQVIAETCYFALFESLAGGRSPGKRIVGLRVVSEQGRAIGAAQALARNLLRFIDALPIGYVLGISSVLLSSRRQRLGDIAAGTLVVRLDRPPVAISVDDSAHPGDEAFVFDRSQSRRIGPREIRLARESLRRHQAGAISEERPALLEVAVEALRSRLCYGPVDADQRPAFLRAVLRAARSNRGM